MSEKDPNQNAVAKWNMAKQDFERLRLVLQKVDELGMKALAGEESAIEPYFAALDVAYANFHTFVRKNAIKKIETLRRSTRNELAKYYRCKKAGEPFSFPQEVRTNLFEIHKAIIAAKQKSGLGIPLKKGPSKGRIKGVI